MRQADHALLFIDMIYGSQPVKLRKMLKKVNICFGKLESAGQ